MRASAASVFGLPVQCFVFVGGETVGHRPDAEIRVVRHQRNGRRTATAPKPAYCPQRPAAADYEMYVEIAIFFV